MKRLIIALALLMSSTALAEQENIFFDVNAVLADPKAKILSSHMNEGANSIWQSVRLNGRVYLCQQGVHQKKYRSVCVTEKQPFTN